RDELVGYYAAIGGFTGGQVNTGIFFLTMKPPEQRPMVNGHRETQQEFMGLVRKQLSQVKGIDRVAVVDLSQSGFSAQRGGSYPVQFMVQGPDWEKLAQVEAEFRRKMKETGIMTDINTDYN